jgi:peptidoglycan hydrolase CwlO-like protein
MKKVLVIIGLVSLLALSSCSMVMPKKAVATTSTTTQLTIIERLNALESQNNQSVQLNAQIMTLNTTVANLQAQITAQQALITTLQSQVTTLQRGY